MSKILTEKELAAELGLSPWTVRGMRLKEACPHFTVGGRIFYRKESVLEWITAKERSQQYAERGPAQIGKLRRID